MSPSRHRPEANDYNIGHTRQLIKAGVLPSGAKLVDARIIFPADSAGGQLDMGWASNGVDAADQDGLFLGASEGDIGAGAAIDNKLNGFRPGFNKEFGAETELEFTCLEASTDSSGNLLQWEVYYIID